MSCVIALTLALAVVAGGGDPSGVRVQAVDARTGVGIDATTTITRAAGRTEVRVTAGGYRPMSAAFDLAPGAELTVTFEMDALEAPADVRAASDAAVLHGYVVDAVTARPVAGAAVALPGLARGTSTDAAGYFRFTL